MLSTDDLCDLMRNLVDHGLGFGLIAEWEEYIHRNQYVHPLPSDQVQAWVGRDLSKYLPGLYWTNILSIELAKKYHIEKSPLPVETKAFDFGRSHLACRLFNRPGDWASYAGQIDTYCENNSRIFSLRRVHGQLRKASNYLELVRQLKNWP